MASRMTTGRMMTAMDIDTEEAVAWASLKEATDLDAVTAEANPEGVEADVEVGVEADVVKVEAVEEERERTRDTRLILIRAIHNHMPCKLLLAYKLLFLNINHHRWRKSLVNPHKQDF